MQVSTEEVVGDTERIFTFLSQTDLDRMNNVVVD
jgi:hypothetical protein